VGYGPGPVKSLHTIASNSFNVDGSMFSSQSRYSATAVRHGHVRMIKLLRTLG
jgi:hypothetical protein